VLVVYGVDGILGASALLLNIVGTDRAVLVLVILAVVLLTAADRIGVLGGRARGKAGMVEREEQFRM
jgi:UDP-GlcNAc:undecaprenyl-phosphate GlcNAc-1-phosphate transferase